MREVDRRSKYNRRIFLQGAATAVPTVAIATSAGLGISDFNHPHCAHGTAGLDAH